MSSSAPDPPSHLRNLSSVALFQPFRSPTARFARPTLPASLLGTHPPPLAPAGSARAPRPPVRVEPLPPARCAPDKASVSDGGETSFVLMRGRASHLTPMRGLV